MHKESYQGYKVGSFFSFVCSPLYNYDSNIRLILNSIHFKTFSLSRSLAIDMFSCSLNWTSSKSAIVTVPWFKNKFESDWWRKENLKLFIPLEQQKSKIFPYKPLPDHLPMVLINKWYFMLLTNSYTTILSGQALKINCTKTVTLLKKQFYFSLAIHCVLFQA